MFTCPPQNVIFNMSHVTCHLSHVTCPVSCVMCHINLFFDKVVKLISGGLLSMGPTPSSFIEITKFTLLTPSRFVIALQRFDSVLLRVLELCSCLSSIVQQFSLEYKTVFFVLCCYRLHHSKGICTHDKQRAVVGVGKGIG